MSVKPPRKIRPGKLPPVDLYFPDGTLKSLRTIERDVVAAHLPYMRKVAIRTPPPRDVAGSEEDCPTSYMLDMLVDPTIASDLQANLEELFPTWVQRHGGAKARRIYHVQVARVVFGSWVGKLLDVIERLAKLVKMFGN